MKRYLITIPLLLSIFLGVVSPVASAKEVDDYPTIHTNIGPGSQTWSKLDQKQLDFLKANKPLLEFQGTTCKIVSLSGCKVVRSENLTINVGDSIQIRVANQSVNQNGRAITSAAFQNSCSWCGFVIASIEIVVFVVSAPASTPAWMLYSSYFIGSSIILGNL